MRIALSNNIRKFDLKLNLPPWLVCLRFGTEPTLKQKQQLCICNTLFVTNLRPALHDYDRRITYDSWKNQLKHNETLNDEFFFLPLNLGSVLKWFSDSTPGKFILHLLFKTICNICDNQSRKTLIHFQWALLFQSPPSLSQSSLNKFEEKQVIKVRFQLNLPDGSYAKWTRTKSFPFV